MSTWLLYLKANAQNLRFAIISGYTQKKFLRASPNIELLTHNFDRNPSVLNILTSLTCITAKKIANEESNAQPSAEMFPNF